MHYLQVEDVTSDAQVHIAITNVPLEGFDDNNVVYTIIMVPEQERGRSGKHFVEAHKVVKTPMPVTLFLMQVSISKMVVVTLGTMAIMLKKDYF